MTAKRTIAVAPGLRLPVDVLGEATAILATRGAGKSYTSAVLVEEAFAARVQLAVLDPTGVYWGLRASADGEPGGGLPIIVLGGPHGDVPLEPTAGGLIADLLVDTAQSLVLDLSDFPTKADQTRFVRAFAERLYRRKARERATLHLIFDEADEFAPQKPMGRDEPFMLGAMEALVRRGRSRGIGVTLITQRSAALNKNVLDLVDTLVVMRMLGPRAAKVVEGWIAQKELRDEAGVIEQLPSLPTGTAWVWAPVRGVLERVRVRRIKTFDSYATPKPGQQRAEPKALREVDLDQLGEQIRATAERAKADDPRELRRQVAERDRKIAELEKRPAADAPPPEVKVERVEVPVRLPDEKVVSEVLAMVTALARGLPDVGSRVEKLLADVRAAGERIDKFAAAERPADREGRAAPGRDGRQAASRGGGEARQVSPDAATPPPPPGTVDGELGKGPMHLLTTLARRHPMRVTVGQLGTLAQRRTSGGAFQQNMKDLRERGLMVEEGDLLVVTDAGLAEAGVAAADPLTVEEVRQVWRSVLTSAQAAMMDLLVRSHPDPVGREELAEHVGKTASGGSFGEDLSTLRRNGLAEDAEGRALRAAEIIAGP